MPKARSHRTTIHIRTVTHPHRHRHIIHPTIQDTLDTLAIIQGHNTPFRIAALPLHCFEIRFVNGTVNMNK
jgi:hypothetical protein